MLSIGKPITAGGARDYFKEDFAKEAKVSLVNSKKSEDDDPAAAPNTETNNENSFRQVSTRSLWCGNLAEELGLSGEVKEKDFALVSEGKHPQTGEQLIRHVKPRTKTKANGKTFQTKTHRAGLDQSITPPKSVSLVAMEDERVIEAHWRAAMKTIKEVEEFTRAKMGNTKPSEKTGKALFAVFLHNLARPDAKTGYAAPDLHTHNFAVNFTKTSDGKFRSLEMREFYNCQKFATAVYRAELVKEMTALDYQMKIDAKTGAPEVVRLSRDYIEANSPRQKEIIETATELGIKSTKTVASNYRQSKDFDHVKAYESYKQIETKFGNQAQKTADKAREVSRQNSLKVQLSFHQPEIGLQDRAEKVRHAFDLAIAKAKEQKNSEKPRRRKISQQSLMADTLNFANFEVTIDDLKPEFAARQKSGELEEFNLDRRVKSGQSATAISNSQKPEPIFEAKDKALVAAVKPVSAQMDSAELALKSEGNLIKNNGERKLRSERIPDDLGQCDFNGESVSGKKVESEPEIRGSSFAGNKISSVGEFSDNAVSGTINNESGNGSALGAGSSESHNIGTGRGKRELPYRVRSSRSGDSTIERVARREDEKNGGSREGRQDNYQSTFTGTGKQQSARSDSANWGQHDSDSAECSETEYAGSDLKDKSGYRSGIERKESGAKTQVFTSPPDSVSETGTGAEVTGGKSEKGRSGETSSGKLTTAKVGQISPRIPKLEEFSSDGIQQVQFERGDRQDILPLEQRVSNKTAWGKAEHLGSGAQSGRTEQELTNISNESGERSEDSFSEALVPSEYFSESSDNFGRSGFSSLESVSLEACAVQFNYIGERPLDGDEYTSSSSVFNGADNIFNTEQPKFEQSLLSGQIYQNIPASEAGSISDNSSFSIEPASLDSIQFSQSELVGNNGAPLFADNFDSAHSLPEFVINIPKVAELKSLSDEEKDKIKEEVLERLSDSDQDRTIDTQSVSYDADDLDEINDRGYDEDFGEISVMTL